MGEFPGSQLPCTPFYLSVDLSKIQFSRHHLHQMSWSSLGMIEAVPALCVGSGSTLCLVT